MNFGDCESFLESTYPDILALCETSLDVSIDSGNFSVKGLSSFNLKGCYYSCAQSYSFFSRKLWRFLLMFLTGFTSLSVLLFFLSLLSSSLSLCTVFHSISSNIDGPLLINPSAVFLFGDFNVRHKD